MKKLAITVMMLMLAGTLRAAPDTFNLAWDAVTNNTDGTAITQVVLYRVTWSNKTKNAFELVGETTNTVMAVPYLPVMTNYYENVAVINGLFESADNTQTWESVSAPAWGRYTAPAPPETPIALRMLITAF